jgi:ABC-type transport system substrate-binding protein
MAVDRSAVLKRAVGQGYCPYGTVPTWWLGRTYPYSCEEFGPWFQYDPSKAKALLEEARPRYGQEDLRGFEWRYLTNLCQDESSFTFTNVHFAGGRRGLTLAADGKTVVAASGALRSFSVVGIIAPSSYSSHNAA